jgi:hypothetical protein
MWLLNFSKGSSPPVHEAAVLLFAKQSETSSGVSDILRDGVTELALSKCVAH